MQLKTDPYKIIFTMQDETDPYAVPKSMGIFQLLESPKSTTTTSVAQRIVANHDAYMVCNCFSLYLVHTHTQYFKMVASHNILEMQK